MIDISTNFYWTYDLITREPLEEGINIHSPLIHIGKRMSAGQYCHTCGVTLCKGGTRLVHMRGSRDPVIQELSQFHEKCPICGNEGKSSTSFTLTMTKHIINLWNFPNNIKCCRDEYGTEYDAVEMLDIINKCVIYFQDCTEFE